MGTNLILDKLPEGLTIGGQMYPIRTDFRTAVLFELMSDDRKLTNRQKLDATIKMFFPYEKPPLTDETIDQVLWFYACGKETKKHDEEDPAEGPTESARAVYSFEHDAGYIYAAFLEQYGIDLTEAQLHWWKFKALFQALNDQVLFSKIIGYRSMDMSQKMTTKEREFYSKMQRIYALPLPKDEQEKLDEITKALMEGRPVTELLRY